MNIGTALFLFITSILLAVPVLAQGPVAVRKIAIELTDVDCSRTSEVFVIAGGDDVPRSATRERPGGCRWTYQKDIGPPFQVGVTLFSLRLRGARTRCRYAVQTNDRENKRQKIGSLEFAYRSNHARDLTLTSDPTSFVLTYLRRLPADKTDEKSVPCSEGASAPGTAELSDVLLGEETLYLHIGLAGKPPDAGWIRFDDALRAMIILNAKKDYSTELRPDDLGAAVVREVARQETDAPPNVSGNEAQAFAAELKKKGFTNLQVKVE